MLKGNELIERVNKLKEEEINASSYFTRYGYGEGPEISFKLPKAETYTVDVYGYYCNKYLELDENISVPISTSESEIKNRIIEIEGINKALSESISNEVKEIEEFLNKKIEILKKKSILKYSLDTQLAPLKEAQSVKEFNIRDKVIENKNQWIKGEDESYFIKNEVFTFRYRVDEHWSYRNDVPKVDILYSLYVNIKGKDYNIADVQVVKSESEKDNYIKKLKSRFEKYFKYEEPTVDEKIIEKLMGKCFEEYSFEELKDRLITMNYNVVKKL